MAFYIHDPIEYRVIPKTEIPRTERTAAYYGQWRSLLRLLMYIEKGQAIEVTLPPHLQMRDGTNTIHRAASKSGMKITTKRVGIKVYVYAIKKPEKWIEPKGWKVTPGQCQYCGRDGLPRPWSKTCGSIECKKAHVRRYQREWIRAKAAR